MVRLSTGLANGTIEISLGSIELNIDEKNEYVLIWNEQVIMSCVVTSRTKKVVFQASVSVLAYLKRLAQRPPTLATQVDLIVREVG